MDDQRRSRALSWAAVAREINHFITDGHPVASSTILESKPEQLAEGDGILQMLLVARPNARELCSRLPDADAQSLSAARRQLQGQILRWDAAALHAARECEAPSRRR